MGLYLGKKLVEVDKVDEAVGGSGGIARGEDLWPDLSEAAVKTSHAALVSSGCGRSVGGAV